MFDNDGGLLGFGVVNLPKTMHEFNTLFTF